MKNKTKKILLGAATLAAISVAGAVPEANAVTGKITATAQIVAPIAIVQISSLKFDKMTVGGVAGTAKMTAAGVRSASGGVGGVNLIGGPAAGQQGKFKVTAGASIAYNVTAPTKATVKTGGGASMTINAFKMGTGSAAKLSGVSNGTATTTAIYGLGGTLNVAAGQTAGSYTGKIALNTIYQ